MQFDWWPWSASHFDLNSICGSEGSDSSSWQFKIWLWSKQSGKNGGSGVKEHIWDYRMSYLQMYFPAGIKRRYLYQVQTQVLSASRFAYGELHLCQWQQEFPLPIKNWWEWSSFILSSLLNGWWVSFKFYAKDNDMISVSPDVHMILMVHSQWIYKFFFGWMPLT